MVVGIAGQLKDRLHGGLISLGPGNQLTGETVCTNPLALALAVPFLGDDGAGCPRRLDMELFAGVLHGHGLAILFGQGAVDGLQLGAVVFHGNLLSELIIVDMENDMGLIFLLA